MPKRPFANHALAFVNRAHALPGFPAIEIVSLAAAGMLATAGAFGTGAMPAPVRMIFWLLLMGWNALKWQAWFAWRVKSPRDWWRAAALGAILLNAMLPLEIFLLLRLCGVPAPFAPLTIWIDALAISAFLALAIALFLGRRKANAGKPIASDDRARLGLDPVRIHAVRAEDHYCRLQRFGDVLATLAEIDGEQIHRGAWVASAAGASPVREGRNWRLRLATGQELPVSATYRGRLRTRGWLRR